MAAESMVVEGTSPGGVDSLGEERHAGASPRKMSSNSAGDAGKVFINAAPKLWCRQVAEMTAVHQRHCCPNACQAVCLALNARCHHGVQMTQAATASSMACRRASARACREHPYSRRAHQ